MENTNLKMKDKWSTNGKDEGKINEIQMLRGEGSWSTNGKDEG